MTSVPTANAATTSGDGDVQPWYKNGLRFKCTACGDCCTGVAGYVWVNRDDILAMAAAMGTDVEEFQARYVRYVGVRKSLVERENGDCVFFDNRSRKCRVYSARPRQCRTWPFWHSNLSTPEAWVAACRACPGSGIGRLYRLEEIQQQASVIRV